jgi:DNA-binding beta-propeller fold protein YncE
MSRFNGPYGAAVDPTGTMVYIADTSNNMIKVAASVPYPTATPIAMPLSLVYTGAPTASPVVVATAKSSAHSLAGSFLFTAGTIAISMLL